nr:IS3 family transposase [Rhizobium sp. Q54]
MKRSRFTDEQIIGILKEHEAGMPVSELCRKHGVSDASIQPQLSVIRGNLCELWDE